MVRQQLLLHGTILIASARRYYLASITSILGNWHLEYRETEEVEHILTASGYAEVEVCLEPENVFRIGRGRIHH